MISLKFLEINLKVKNALIENIGILGIFILYSLRDGLSIDDISYITRFNKELLNEKLKELERRGYLSSRKINSKGLKVLNIYSFIQKINNSSLIIDLYSKNFFFIKKEFLKDVNKFDVYPPRLFDYGVLKKINDNKKVILDSFNTEKLRIYYDDFELSYNVKKVYYADFEKILFGGTDFKIGERVLKISYDIKNLKNEDLRWLFEDFYFSLFSKEKYTTIKEYKGKVFLPTFYNIYDIECDRNKNVDFNKICLLNISVNIEERVNERFIDIESMIRSISESN